MGKYRYKSVPFYSTVSKSWSKPPKFDKYINAAGVMKYLLGDKESTKPKVKKKIKPVVKDWDDYGDDVEIIFLSKTTVGEVKAKMASMQKEIDSLKKALKSTNQILINKHAKEVEYKVKARIKKASKKVKPVPEKVERFIDLS